MHLSKIQWAMVILGSVGVAATALIVADPAFAGRVPRGGPAPLIGVGLPIIGGVLIALEFVRRFRRKG